MLKNIAHTLGLIALAVFLRLSCCFSPVLAQFRSLFLLIWPPCHPEKSSASFSPILQKEYATVTSIEICVNKKSIIKRMSFIIYLFIYLPFFWES